MLGRRHGAVPKATAPKPGLERFQGTASLVREDPEPADTSPAEDGATTSENDAAAPDNAAAPSGDDDKKEADSDAAAEGDAADPDAADLDAAPLKGEQEAGSEEEAGAESESENAMDAAQSRDDDAIAQAEARVDAAQANANTTHEALVGVQLAIKEVLAVSTSNIDNAHEGGANADDLLTNLQNANEAAQKAIKLREQLKESRARDETAQGALLEAKKLLLL